MVTSDPRRRYQICKMSLTNALWWCSVAAQALGASGEQARPLVAARVEGVSPYIGVWIIVGVPGKVSSCCGVLGGPLAVPLLTISLHTLADACVSAPALLSPQISSHTSWSSLPAPDASP